MERITYRKTLDVHKNGVQFLLQGFETADKLSRVVEISLMASGDAIDFPLERVIAMMYVTSPGDKEPSINECTIVDNKVVYEVLPIVTEGITEMQVKLIETSPEGAKSVLASPKFAVEVTKSGADDESAEKTTTFTALEEAMAKAKIAYDERFLRMELTSDCIFKAYYADGTYYETDVLQKLFMNGNVLLSESFAHGGTGIRAGEDTDNSMYYSNVSRSEALNAKDIMQNSEELLEEVKLHGVYTAFKVDFETGEVEYVSPSFKFNVNLETGELDAIGQEYTFDDEVGRIVTKWLGDNGIILDELQAISGTHTEEIANLKTTTAKHTEDIASLVEHKDTIYTELAGVNGEITKLYAGVEDAKVYRVPWNVDKNLGSILANPPSSSFVIASTLKVATPAENSKSFTAINSGTILLSFKTEIGSNSTRNPRLEIRKNNEAIFTQSGLNSLDNKTFAVSITVEHEDVITIYLYAETSGDDKYGQLSVKNFDILANVDTPYKYVDVYAATVTLNDVINALVGE